ncbi:MAG: hypothetical protein ACJ8GN_16150 [Longimicrobiaceae bacterium]
MVRSAVLRYRPEAVRRARGHAVYVWLVADGEGRVTRTAFDAERPRGDAVRDVIREKYPEVDTDAWMERVPEALFPVAGVVRLRPGELGPDTVVVIWADPPTPLGSDPPPPRGEFLFGRAAAEQFSPARVRQAAREAGRGQTVWFVKSETGALLDVGVYDGGRDYDAIRALLQPRYPGRAIQCSAGFALIGADGRFVPTVAVRLGSPGT